MDDTKQVRSQDPDAESFFLIRSGENHGDSELLMDVPGETAVNQNDNE
jgi:hypothetical protein